METVMLIVILILIIMWINLSSKINKSQLKSDELLKEIKLIKRHLSGTVPAPEVKTADRPETVTVKEPERKPEIPETVIIPPQPKRVAVPKPKKERKQVNYEKLIGENLFGKIGIFILVIGMGFFVKYAIDNNWINEVLRTVLGFTVGAVLIGLSWFLRKKYHAFSSVLAGGGFAVFYVTVAVAFHYYGLFSQTGAFIILVVCTVLMSGLAVLYDRRELAIVALVGGFVAPFLVSSGSGNYAVLFTYVFILDMGMFVLSLYKKWGELPIACFFLTWLTLGLYLLNINLGNTGNVQLIHLQIFAVLFYLVFQASVAPIVRINRERINQLLLGVIVLNNFVFLYFGLTLHWSMHYTDNYAGLITALAALVNIATYLWMRKRGERFPFLQQTFVWLALIFVSITIPIQLEGSMITVFWASEMIMVVLLYLRFKLKAYDVFCVLLFTLALLSYILDINNMLRWGASPSDYIFLNGGFFTGIYLGISLLASALLFERFKESMPTENRIITYFPSQPIALLSASIVFYIAFILDFYLYISDTLFAQVLMRVFTSGVLFTFTWLFRSRFDIVSHIKTYMLLLGISVVSYISLSDIVNYSLYTDIVLRIFQWVSLLIVVSHGLYLIRIYYQRTSRDTIQAKSIAVYLSILTTVVLVVTTYNLLDQLSLSDEANAGFSISLGLAGFVQMALGMRLHYKVLRLVSLTTFGVVLFKLLIVDLWLMPTVGKIIVFIILGILLLVLSFLYQKLKAVLFDDVSEEEKK